MVRVPQDSRTGRHGRGNRTLTSFGPIGGLIGGAVGACIGIALNWTKPLGQNLLANIMWKRLATITDPLGF